MTQALPLPARRRAGLAFFLLPLGIAGFAAAWVLLASATGRQSSWMALLAALDAALLLRIGGMAAGPRRAAWAVGATVGTIVLANWGIVAAGIGRLIGLAPLDSALKLGTGLAWTVARLLNGPADLAWLAVSVLVAAAAGRWDVPRVSGRRRAP